tara:strand:- start:1507 stop:4389 length:2883 start_codon:yes stop_codon:yes gene_type:complete
MNEALMIIDINFFYGGIGKYRRNRELQYKDEENITRKETMFKEGTTLFDLAQRLPVYEDNVEEISYQEYSSEKLIQDGRTIVWYRPPREFPNKTFNGKPIQFFCNNCGINDKGTGHRKECFYQNKNTLICHSTWVINNLRMLNNANLVDSDNTVKYISLPGCEIQEKRPTVVNRITIKRKYGNSYAYFHIYDNCRIRIEKLPFKTKWKQDANWIINYLNRYGSDLFYEKIIFDEDYSFVSQIVENKRLFDKNDNHLGIKVDSKKVSNSKITKFKTRLGEENKYDVNVTKQYFSFEDVFLKGLEEKKYEAIFKKIKIIIQERLAKTYNGKKTNSSERNPSFYNNIFEQNFIEVNEIIHSTGAIQRFYKTLTFEDKYLNMLFIDCVYQDFQLPKKNNRKLKEDALEKFQKMKENFVEDFSENFKLENYYQQKIQMTNLQNLDTYIISNREIKFKSVKHCLKLEKEPPISDKQTQPFNRGLFPYSFKGRVLFPDTVIDHIGKKKDGLYYPYCKMATKPSLKKYIKALIQGFPKNEEEADKYGMDWNYGKPIDTKSAVKPVCEIKKGIFMKVEKKGRIIEPLGKINIDKFEECAKEKSSQLDGSKEVNNVEFSFLRPLTIDTLFTISNKKIAAQAIPEESLIAYCHNEIVYYMFKGKTLMAQKMECKEDGHGFIYKKEFFPMDYNKCVCKKNILQTCEGWINKSLLEHKIKKILIFTESEGFYWNNNGYKELMCNVNIKSDKSLYKIEIKDENNEPFPIQLAPSTQVKIRKNLRSTLKEFPRNFFYKYDTVKKNTRLEKQRDKKYKSPFGFNEVLVNGVYNDFGKLYQGTPLNRVGKKEAGYDFINSNEQDLKKEDYKQKIQRMITNIGLNIEGVKKCFRRKNIENFIKIASPIEVDFFIKSSTLFNLKLKIFKINVPFSNEENLKGKISNFTSQFINKTIDNFEQSAVIFYDNGNSINYHYSQ